MKHPGHCIHIERTKNSTFPKDCRKGLQKIIGLLISVVISACILGGCTTPGDFSISKTKIVLAEADHSLFYAPLYVAMEEGYFAEEGIGIELISGSGSDVANAAVYNDAADIGLMGSETAFDTYIDSMGDPIVHFALLNQRAGNFLVARRPTTNFSWEMLAGSEVLGGSAGSMPEIVLEYILKKNSLYPGVDLSVNQSIAYGSTAAAFASGQGDYTVEFEPQATQLEAEGKGYVVAALGEYSGLVPFTSLGAKTSYLQAHPEVIRGFCTALQKGMDYVNTHTPEEISHIIRPQFPDTEPDSMTNIIARYCNMQIWNDHLTYEEEAFTLLQNLLEEADALSERRSYETLVTTKFTGKDAIADVSGTPASF